MNETINDRIEALINEYCNGNKAAFAKRINFSPTGISSYLGKQRRSKPSIDMVARILQAFDVDARWLILGDENLPSSTATAHASGDRSIAAVNSEVRIGENLILEEKVKHLEALLEEKERLIRVLMDKK
jgi:transcriptional regulator with XRE-family HTH domain